MSTAKLNVWITEFGDPCHIMQPHFPEGKLEEWFVHIADCHGNPLVWCGRTYAFLPARCGHLEVEIPPGCYAVFASHTPADQIWRSPFGNRLTHLQVVRANCGDHVCVTLFSPTGWACGTWFAEAVKTQYAAFDHARIEPQLARTAVTAVEAFVGKLDKDPFAANLTRLVQQGPPRTGEGGPQTGGGGPRTPREPERPQ